MAEMNDKLTLKNAKVVFFNPEDTGMGTSITIDCTEKDLQEQITSWYKENNIGKDNPGVPNFKEWTNDDGETFTQLGFKLTDRTQYAGLNGLGKDDIGRGAVVDLIARAFTYNNKFTGGKDRVGQSVSAIVVRSGKTGSNDADLAELLGDTDESEEEEVKAGEIPF